MTALPDDLDVQRQLTMVRASVMEATRHVRSPRRSTRFRTTRNLIIAAAAIAVLTAGAIIAVQASPRYITTTVTCYEHNSLDSESIPVSGYAGEDATSMDPYEGCALMWRNDLFDPANNNDPNPNDGTSPVPELVICTLSDGSPATFPREDGPPNDTDFCGALGLADWGSD